MARIDYDRTLGNLSYCNHSNPWDQEDEKTWMRLPRVQLAENRKSCIHDHDAQIASCLTERPEFLVHESALYVFVNRNGDAKILDILN